jgi:hypothetical protein
VSYFGTIGSRRVFSQERLAEIARISVESVGALERGVRRSYRGTVDVLATALRLADEQRVQLETGGVDRARTGSRDGRSSTDSRRATTGHGRLQRRRNVGAARLARRRVSIARSGGSASGRHCLRTDRLDGGPGAAFATVEFQQTGPGGPVAREPPGSLCDRFDRVHDRRRC